MSGDGRAGMRRGGVCRVASRVYRGLIWHIRRRAPAPSHRKYPVPLQTAYPPHHMWRYAYINTQQPYVCFRSVTRPVLNVNNRISKGYFQKKLSNRIFMLIHLDLRNETKPCYSIYTWKIPAVSFWTPCYANNKNADFYLSWDYYFGMERAGRVRTMPPRTRFTWECLQRICKLGSIIPIPGFRSVWRYKMCPDSIPIFLLWITEALYLAPRVHKGNFVAKIPFPLWKILPNRECISTN